MTTEYLYCSSYGTQQIELVTGSKRVKSHSGEIVEMPETLKIRFQPTYKTEDPYVAKLIEEHDQFKIRKIQRMSSEIPVVSLDEFGKPITEDRLKENEAKKEAKLNNVHSQLQPEFAEVVTEEPKDAQTELLKNIMSKLESLEHENKELKAKIAENEAKKEQQKQNLAKARAARKKKSPAKK